MKGSLTVEASYIFPFCFCVVGIVCYLGIFLYNQSVLKMTGYESVIQVMGEQEEKDTAMEEVLRRSAIQNAKERLLAVKDLELEIQQTSSKTILQYRGTQTMLNLPLDVTVVYEKTFPEFTLRLVK